MSPTTLKSKISGNRQWPAGRRVSIQAVYDRSDLIHRAIDKLNEVFIEESIIVALVCAVFLMHARSALVAIVMLPIGVLIAFIAMHLLGLNSNIMSLGGIAIAIGAMADAAIVMIENAHKHLARCRPARHASRSAAMIDACREVGPVIILQPADHHGFVPAGIYAGSAGRADVRAARLYQDFCHGRRRAISPSRWCRR